MLRKKPWTASSFTALRQGSIGNCFSLFGIHLVQAIMVKETHLGWHGFFMGKKSNKISRVPPLCIFSTISEKKNWRSFDNEEQSDQALKSSFLRNLFLWVKMYLRYRFYVFKWFFWLVGFLVKGGCFLFSFFLDVPFDAHYMRPVYYGDLSFLCFHLKKLVWETASTDCQPF